VRVRHFVPFCLVLENTPSEKHTYSFDLEERLDRFLSPTSNITPVSIAIALVPDAASISGACLGGGGGLWGGTLMTDQAGLDASSITVAPANNLCRIFIIITSLLHLPRPYVAGDFQFLLSKRAAL